MEAIESKETTPTAEDSKKKDGVENETLTPALSQSTGRGGKGVQVFWMAFWLAMALVGAKVYHIRPPDNWGGREINRYVSDVGIVTAGGFGFSRRVWVVGGGVGLFWPGPGELVEGAPGGVVGVW